MTSPRFEALPRPQRRHLLEAERRRRKSGDWGEWERIEIRDQVPRGAGWLSECDLVFKNEVFSVLRRPLADGVCHLAVSSLSGVRPTWWEMQRIKDEIAGAKATAVEIYPPAAEVVDGADMFHIWALPNRLSFGLQKEAGR